MFNLVCPPCPLKFKNGTSEESICRASGSETWHKSENGRPLALDCKTMNTEEHKMLKIAFETGRSAGQRRIKIHGSQSRAGIESSVTQLDTHTHTHALLKRQKISHMNALTHKNPNTHKRHLFSSHPVSVLALASLNTTKWTAFAQCHSFSGCVFQKLF